MTNWAGIMRRCCSEGKKSRETSIETEPSTSV